MTTRRQRAEIRRIELATQGALSTAWRVVEAMFRARLLALLTDIGDRPLSADEARRLDRYRALLDQTEAVINIFANEVGFTVVSAQIAAALRGIQHADTLLTTALDGRMPHVRLPVEAVNQFVGMLNGGNRLSTYLQAFGSAARKRVSDVLVAGVASGTNTNELVPQVMKALDVSRQSAVITARQAVYGAYRGAALEQYRVNADVVAGWTWVSALQPARTCALCWAMHGTEHTLDETLDSHPSCRCTMAPRTRSWAELGFKNIPEQPRRTTGVQRFAKLSDEQQRQILGPGKFALYKAGKLKLPDIVEQTTSDTWGNGRRERPLREVIA